MVIRESDPVHRFGRGGARLLQHVDRVQSRQGLDDLLAVCQYEGVQPAATLAALAQAHCGSERSRRHRDIAADWLRRLAEEAERT